MKKVNFLLTPIAGVLGWYIGSKKKKSAVENFQIRADNLNNSDKVYQRVLPVLSGSDALAEEDYETWYALLVIMYHLYDVQNGLSELDNEIVALSPLIRADYQRCAEFIAKAKEGTHLIQLKINSKEEIANLLGNRK